MENMEKQTIERMIQELLGNEVFQANESYTYSCQPLNYGQSSIKCEQRHQITDEYIQNLPPLIDDFDTWLQSSYYNNLLPAASYDYEFLDDFGDCEFLSSEQVIEDPSLPEHDKRFFPFENTKLDSVSPSIGNIGSIVLHEFVKQGETKISIGEGKNFWTERDRDITYAELSKYFFMPITKAAKKMSVGLTVLKKKCREYGIPRWPYRKMKSLQSLIHSVQELAKDDGEIGENRSRLTIEVLEEQARQMEKMPSMELPENTKRLRQACFKANYKRKRLQTQGFQTPNATTNCYSQSSS